jgi:hypothetical protein
MTACHKLQNTPSKSLLAYANLTANTTFPVSNHQIRMSADVEAVMQAAADAAGGVLTSLGKRTNDGAGLEGESEPKSFRTEGPPQTSVPPITATTTIDTAPTTTVAAAVTTPATTTAPAVDEDDDDDEEAAEDLKGMDRPPMTKAREVRLDQNRKAARDSRRRKKVMIEELQRSVIFFSRANGTLKQQNDELSRLFMQAQNQAAAVDTTGALVQPAGEPSATGIAPAAAAAATQMVVKPEGEQASNSFQQAQAQAVATQAMFESQGFPAAAARAAAQTMNASAPSADPATVPAPAVSQSSLPPMQPGATMQAMANFQQAAAAAMQAAIQGMQGIPGVNMNQLAATPVGANPQQAYTDTMTALAMQQAAAAAAAGGQQQFVMQPGMHFMAHPMLAWQQQQQQAQQQQQTQQQPPPQILPQAAAAPEPPKQD